MNAWYGDGDPTHVSDDDLRPALDQPTVRPVWRAVD